MRKFNKKGWKGNRSAVSEILGNILILGITVALFTSVMAFVSAIPEPPEPVSATFDAQLSSDILSITHTGGSDLLYGNVMIVVTADGRQSSFMLSEGSFSSADSSYLWKQGATWALNLTDFNGRFESSEDPYIPVSLHVAVRYITLPEYLWSKTLKTDEVLPIQITNFQVLDEFGHNTNIIAVGSNFTVRMNVLAPSPDIQVQSGGVKVDLSSLYNGTGSPVTLVNTGGSLYSYTSTSPPISAAGTYTVRISVTDNGGNTIQEFRQIRIMVDTSNITIPVFPPTTPPDEPTTPGMNNPNMTNDLYFLTYEDWQFFQLFGGTVNVVDTYALTENRFVLAFKGDTVGLSSPRDWGGKANGSPRMVLSTYDAAGNAIRLNYDVSTLISATVNLGGVNWDHLVFNFNDNETTALNNRGLFIKVDIKLKSGGSDVMVSQAFVNFYNSMNPGTYTKSYGSGGQIKGVYEIGDDMYIRVFASDPVSGYNPSASASFYAGSLHNYNLRQINVTYLGASGNTVTFKVETFEVVRTYLSSASLFIYCENLNLNLTSGGTASLRVSAKVYVEQDLVVGAGQTYTTIQAAINAATSGSTIRVFAGTYSDDLIVNKQLTIYGNGSAISIINIQSTSNGLSINANGVEFRGFSILQTTGDSVNFVVRIIGSTTIFSDNIITNNQRLNTILLNGSSNSVVGNNIIGCSKKVNSLAATINAINSVNLTIVGNTLTGGTGYNENQILAISCLGIKIIDNLITTSDKNENARTINVSNSNNSTIKQNDIQGRTGYNQNQIRVVSCANITISSNTMVTSDQNNIARTIYLINSPDSVIENNVNNGAFGYNQNQLRVESSDRILVINNTFVTSDKNELARTIYIVNSNNCNVTLNTINGVNGYNENQIKIENSSSSYISYNTVTRSDRSGVAKTIMIDFSPNSVITFNNIMGSSGYTINQINVSNSPNTVVSYNNAPGSSIGERFAFWNSNPYSLIL